MNQNQHSTQSPPPYSSQEQPQNPDFLTSYDEKYLYDPSQPTHSRPASPIPPPTPRRGSQESSAGESDYDVDIKPLMTTSHSARVWNVVNTKSHLNLRIVNATTGQAVYYVDNSCFTPGKPDVTICRGSDKTDPIIGVVKWSHMYSRHYFVGVGNPAVDEKSVVWEQVKAERSRHPEYKWTISSPSGQRHQFMWVRMHGTEAAMQGGDGTNSMSFKNFKLIDCASHEQTGNGEVLAVFASNRFKSWNKMGKIIVKVDGAARGWGDQWELFVLCSVMGLLEMSRRRSRNRRGGGATGGP